MTRLLTRMLSAGCQERALREEVDRLAAEQGALRRVARLAAGGAAPGALFAAVAEEARQVLPEADFTMVGCYDDGPAVEVVGAWSRAGRCVLLGRRSELGGQNVSTLVFETGQPARARALADGGDAVTAAGGETGMRSAAGAPICVGGRLWGVIIAGSVRENALRAASERRLAALTELTAAAVASAEARAELAASCARIFAAAGDTRRHVERHLHDGPQRPVSLALQFRAAQAAVP
jgi:GAF domain-containing protein